MDDGSLNERVLAGLLQAEASSSLVVEFVEPEEPSAAALEDVLDGRPRLVVLVGPVLLPVAQSLAPRHPNTDFLIVDARSRESLPNLATIHWDEADGVRLGGAAAALPAGGPVAAILQAPARDAVRWDEAFRRGAAERCPGCGVLVVALGPEASASEGRVAAEELDRSGARAVFATGGPAALSALPVLAQSEIWVAGGWDDVYITLFQAGAARGAHRVFTSVVKDAAPTVLSVVRDWQDGSLHGEQGGWSVAESHDAQGWLPPGVTEALRELR